MLLPTGQGQGHSAWPLDTLSFVAAWLSHRPSLCGSATPVFLLALLTSYLPLKREMAPTRWYEGITVLTPLARASSSSWHCPLLSPHILKNSPF